VRRHRAEEARGLCLPGSPALTALVSTILCLPNARRLLGSFNKRLVFKQLGSDYLLVWNGWRGGWLRLE
jgi:hypothetical protein